VGSEALDAVEAMVQQESPATGLYLLMARLALHTHSGHTALASAALTPCSADAKVKVRTERMFCQGGVFCVVCWRDLLLLWLCLRRKEGSL